MSENNEETKKEKKGFNTKVYATFAVILVAAALVVMVALDYNSKYLAYDETKIATNYADSIIQSGDGYNAYKYTALSKSQKFGDFIRKYYIYPVVYPGYEPGDDTGDYEGYNDEEKYASDATLEDEENDNVLAYELADAMYPYFEELMQEYGWDNYDAVFTEYFAALPAEREAIFGDQYLSDDVMFSALETDVSYYGEFLKGTSATVDADSGVTIGEDKAGLYQDTFGDDYKITINCGDPVTIEDLDAYVDSLDADVLATYGIEKGDIGDACTLDITATLEDGSTLYEFTVYEMKIGHTWYVDNTTTSTYGFFDMVNNM